MEEHDNDFRDLKLYVDNTDSIVAYNARIGTQNGDIDAAEDLEASSNELVKEGAIIEKMLLKRAQEKFKALSRREVP